VATSTVCSKARFSHRYEIAVDVLNLCSAFIAFIARQGHGKGTTGEQAIHLPADFDPRLQLPSLGVSRLGLVGPLLLAQTSMSQTSLLRNGFPGTGHLNTNSQAEANRRSAGQDGLVISLFQTACTVSSAAQIRKDY
jgi:hypothetical protein